MDRRWLVPADAGVRTFLVVSAWSALVATLSALLPPRGHWDGVQLWVAARALLDGRDPYAAVVASGYPWPLYYPLPAVLLMVRLAWLPQTVARIVWSSAIGAVFAWAFRHRPAVVAAAVGYMFVVDLFFGQLGPAMIVGTSIPAFAFLWAAKPSLGLALFVAYPSRTAAIGIGVFLLASLAVMPDWPALWLAHLGTAPRRAPILLPGGFLLLLALLRWRTPEGRLLTTLAVIPHGAYDALALLCLVPKTVRQTLSLACLGFAGEFVAYAIYGFTWGIEVAGGVWVIRLLTVYLPVLLVVLGSGPRIDLFALIRSSRRQTTGPCLPPQPLTETPP